MDLSASFIGDHSFSAAGRDPVRTNHFVDSNTRENIVDQGTPRVSPTPKVTALYAESVGEKEEHCDYDVLSSPISRTVRRGGGGNGGRASTSGNKVQTYGAIANKNSSDSPQRRLHQMALTPQELYNRDAAASEELSHITNVHDAALATFGTPAEYRAALIETQMRLQQQKQQQLEHQQHELGHQAGGYQEGPVAALVANGVKKNTVVASAASSGKERKYRPEFPSKKHSSETLKDNEETTVHAYGWF
jgi:hypothetical protein